MDNNIEIKDDINNTFIFNNSPKRIISLVPSITQSLYYFGLNENIKGITDYCPKDVTEEYIEKVGGVKNPDINKILSLNPDIIFVNIEENRKKDAIILSEKTKVFVTNIKNINNVKTFLNNIGIIFNKKELSKIITQKINKAEKKVSRKTKSFNFLYLVWKDPYMVAGNDTYISNLIELVGGNNIFTKKDNLDYYEIKIDEILQKKTDIIFLPNEPYNFGIDDKFTIYKQLDGKIELLNIVNIDGYIVNWWGVKTPEAIIYISDIVNKITI